MKFFEGKTPTERNKIIVALVLGVLSVLAIGNMIFSPFSSRKKTVTVNISPTPAASATPNRTGDTVITPLKQNEIDSVYISTPVSVQYPPGASDAGRNIFAFYEPPIPTPWSPTPYVTPKTPTPTPIPTPTPYTVVLSFISRQSAYAGEKSFKLDVGGDKFTPGTYIFFNGAQLPTNYVGPQQLSAEVPANYIASAGQITVEVRSPDGKLFSNPIYFNVQQPPPPQFSYLGIVSRKRGNNDMAYIMEPGKTLPTSVRLDDRISGRFRVISITPAKLLVQDTQLGFLPPYSIELIKGSGQSSSTTTMFPNRQNPNRQNPNFPDPSMVQPNPNPQCPPGIPCNNIRPYQTPQPQKKDDDDVDDEDGDN